MLPGTLIVSDNTETIQDTNTTWTSSNVNLVASAGGSGTVNYVSGAVSVTFGTAPTNGQNIYLSYAAFKPGRPQAILNFNNQLKMYPVPDRVYRFKVQAFQIVTPLVNATDTPDLEEWGPAIAYGTARNIMADFGEHDMYAQVTALYKEQIAYIERRTHQNLLNTRSAPNF